jgi:phage terminase small subunit
MAQCDNRERAFVEYRMSGHSIAESAKLAGYGHENSTAGTFARIGNRLVNRPRVQDALIELTRKAIRSDGPEAVKTVREIMGDKHHPQRLKAAQQVLDRVDPTIQRVDQSVKVEVVDRQAEALAQLKLLRQLGVAREKLEELFGYSGLPLLEKQLATQEGKEVIEAEYVDVTPGEDRHG